MYQSAGSLARRCPASHLDIRGDIHSIRSAFATNIWHRSCIGIPTTHLRREGIMSGTRTAPEAEGTVHVDTGAVILEGNLTLPARAAGVVLFAHGSGSGRHSPRNRYVAE